MSNRKRVLHVMGTMNCGGAENMIMSLFRHIDKTKISFEFLVHSNNTETGYFDKEIVALGGRIHHINSQGKLGPLVYINSLRKHLRSHGPYDIVHCHMDWQGGVVAMASRLEKVPCVIVHSHTSSMYNTSVSRRIIYKIQKILIGRYATEYWACSEDAGKFLFGPNEHTRVIPNAIDLNRYGSIEPADSDALRRQWGCKKDTCVLVNAGKFCPVKNQEFLIDLAACLQQQAVDYRLILAGNNNNAYGQKVVQKVERAGLSRHVKFLGVRDDLARVLSACDQFLFPSMFEGFGIVAIEAQAVGMRCLLSPGIPAEVDMGLNLTTRMDSMNPTNWAKALLAPVELKPPSKGAILNAIRDRGYDIATNCSVVEELYSSF